MSVLDFIANNKEVITNWTAIIAASAAATTSIVNVVNMKRQRTHYRKSLTPIASIPIGDYEDRLFVALRNDGAGPMIVDEIEILQAENNQRVASALIKIMPDGLAWDTFVNDIRKRAFAPGKDIELLAISEGDDDQKWPDIREDVRAALAKLVVKVKYRSIYDDEHSVTRSLDWFGRDKKGK